MEIKIDLGLAPEGNLGPIQVIPNRGAHKQIYITESQALALVTLGLVRYEPEYGPNANVYQPVEPATAEEILSWFGEIPPQLAPWFPDPPTLQPTSVG